MGLVRVRSPDPGAIPSNASSAPHAVQPVCSGPWRPCNALLQAAGRARPARCRPGSPAGAGRAASPAPRTLWRRDGGGLVHGRLPGGPAGAAPAAAQPRRQPGAAAAPRRGVPQGRAVGAQGTAGLQRGAPGPGRAGRGAPCRAARSGGSSRGRGRGQAPPGLVAAPPAAADPPRHLGIPTSALSSAFSNGVRIIFFFLFLLCLFF